MHKIAPKYTWLFLLILTLITALSGLYTISIGIVHTPIKDVITVLSAHITGSDSGVASDSIIWHIRAPRAVLSSIVGAGLAVVGCILQAVMRNPLADPHLFGISSGGALGAVVVIVWIGGGLYAMSLGAFLGAVVAMALVMMIAYGGKRAVSAERLLLSGVAVSFLLISLTNFVIFQGENNSATSVLFWMLGGMGLARWDMIWIPFIVIAIGVLYATVQGRNLNTIMAGDHTALTLGVNANSIRLQLFLLCALITGVCVAISGAIGFIGLMIPHACRFFVGANNRILIATSAVVGGLFLLWADALSRYVFAPQELPIGIITAFIGGVFFVVLMLRKNH